MMELDRRQFGPCALGSLLTFSLLETLFARDAFADDVKPITARWLAELNQLSKDVKGAQLTQIQWQNQVEQLITKLDLPELLKFIDFEKLERDVTFKEKGERSLRARFPEVEGLPTRLVFGHQVFALQKGQSVVPHGHNNMATAFVVLNGEFHGRHYDRLEDEREFMVIKPTIDRQFGRGQYSTISDDKDNVHWFKAATDTGFIFNIHVLSVKPGRTGRVYVDPDGEKLSGERIKARKIKLEEAYKKYG